MQSIPLDISSFVKAINSLEVALLELQKKPKNLFVRDATIHRFEYTYELSHKMLKRYLEMTEANSQSVDQMSFSILIRTGAEKGLLQNSWDAWSVYKAARNLTSLTYIEAKAIEVCEVIPKFLADAQFLMQEIKKRIE